LKDADLEGMNVYIGLLEPEDCFVGHQTFCSSEMSKASEKCQNDKEKLVK
jgi:hypothetical protein